MNLTLPPSAAELTPAMLTAIASNAYPGASVTGVTLDKAYEYGDGEVSTSPRANMELEYGPGTPPDFPRHVVVKTAFDLTDESMDVWNTQLDGLFETEVNFYNRLRPQLDIEAPRSLGGYFEPSTKRYVLILEDLTKRGGTFPTFLEDHTVEQIERVLDTHAKLHASLWDSPRFATDLAWIDTHLAGRVETHMRNDIPEGIRDQVAKHKFKREILGRLGTTPDALFAGKCAVKAHQSRLPQTLLHGDSHIANSYRLPDGTGGLLDWQLSVRGYAMHDVSYYINSSLPVEVRRAKEREILAFYRDRLGHYGVANPPDLDTLFLEHRRASLWPLYMGWLACPVENYGWETAVVALNRVAAAFEDHETYKLVEELL